MILVVDDNPRVVELLGEVLRKEGYRVETAADGLQAYEKVKEPDCKCMLLDIRMPKVNGVELLMLMQAEGIHVPTILMGGFDDFDEKEMKNFSNVVKYMHKPFELKDMIAAVNRYAKSPAK